MTVPARRDAITKLDTAPEPLTLFEQALGGRRSVIDSLTIDSTPEIQRFVRLLLDPQFDDLSLAELAEQSHIGLTDLLRAYRNATLAKAQILAVKEIASRLPALAADVMIRALPQEILCPVCRGEGTMPKRSVNKTPVPCKTCGTTGKVTRPASVSRQRLALEIAELIKPPKDRPTLLQQINIGTGAQPSAPGSLEQLQQAVTSILYNRGAIIDVRPVEESTPTEQGAP